MSSTRTLGLVFAAIFMVGCSSGSGAVTPTEENDPGKHHGSKGSSNDGDDGTSDPSTDAAGSSTPGTEKTPAVNLVDLPKTSGLYRSTCDGSGAAMIDANHFLDVNDEEQTFRIYERGAKAAPVQSIAGSKLVGVSSGVEADLEELTRRGDRIYGVTSHGRKKDGTLDLARYHFYAFDVSGSVPNVQLTSAGTSKRLVQDLVTSANWETPDTQVISAISKASQLDDDANASLAPEDSGLNIEGLVALPTGELVIGLRNPGIGNAAIAVTLTNPDDALAGKTTRFGKAFRLDLGGLHIRALTWSPVHEAVLIIGGSKSSGSTFRLFRWVPSSGAAPTPVADITPPDGGSPEAIVTYPNTKDVQILFDQGDNGCKDADTSDKSFTDVIVHVD